MTAGAGPLATSVPPGDADEVSSLARCADVPTNAIDSVDSDVGVFNVDPVLHGVLLTYAAEHGDTFGGLWIDRQSGGTVVVAFTDDPEPHRQALAARRPSPDDVHTVEPPPEITDDRPIGEWDVPFDVVQVAYTEAQIISGISTTMNVLQADGFQVEGVGADLMRNRVSVTPSAAITRADFEAIALTIAEETRLPLDMVCVDATFEDEEPEPIEAGSPLEVIVLPDDGGNFPPDTPVECGGVLFPLGALDELAAIDEVDPGLRNVLEEWLSSPEGSFWPQDGWVVLFENDRTAQFIKIGADTVAFVGAEKGRTGWIWSGASASAPCEVNRVLSDGLGKVEWELDPDGPAPDADATELHVLATERACTGGRELGERLLGPQVVETDAAVRITFAAIPLPGNHGCPSNPATPVTVTLIAPLGDRELREGLLVGSITDLVDD